MVDRWPAVRQRPSSSPSAKRKGGISALTCASVALLIILEREGGIRALAFGFVVVALAAILSLALLAYFGSERQGITRTLAFGFVVVALATIWSLALLAYFTPAHSLAAGPFGIAKFENTTEAEAGGTPATQAGSHPYAMTTTIEFSTHVQERQTAPNGSVKDLEVNLAAGMIVNPDATEIKCTEEELDSEFTCPTASAVGVAHLKLEIPGAEGGVPVFNMVSPRGAPAELGFDVAGILVHIYGNSRTGGDYGLSAKTADILEKGGIYSTALTLWGDPSSSIHNEERGECARRDPEEKQEDREKFEEKVKEAVEKGEPLPKESEYFEENSFFVSCPVETVSKPFLTMPTSCTSQALTTTMSVNSWEEPARFVPASAESPAVAGCEKLNFSPSLLVRPALPETTSTESPTGLEVDLKIPQDESLTDLAESDLKEAVVTLPTGVTVSPSAANGLDVCPLLRGREPAKEEKEHNKEDVGIDLESAQPANCPPGSKLGSVEVVTPLLAQPLAGSVYVAQQGNLPGAGANPFGSLFAMYLVAEGNGAIIKLPGKIELDEATGQVSAKFGEDPTTGFYLPELPFSELKMRFFGGPRAPLVTPSSCGTYTTTSQLTPWDGNPAAEPGSSFTINSGCGPRSFSPALTAGTTNPQAGGFSPETVMIARNNGEQNLSGVTVTTPPGLLGMLSKVPLCGEPQASQGTCGEASNIGETTESVGPGEDPYWVKGGKVYLTGPYDNQPFGLSIVVPTVAGLFTLTGNGGPGREIVRASIAVNPKTGALTVASGQLPTMLEGVPLDIRTINVDINRGEFTFNPTNCEEFHVTSSITSTEGTTATPSSRFQAANCAALPFQPSFSASTQGDASEIGNGASLNVKVTQHAGEAGIRSVHLELPEKLPARLKTLQKACPEATFNANPANCPPSSDVGTGIAHTPVLPVPLEGPAYFVSHGGKEYPELVFVLQGDGVTINLAGETHISAKTKITSSTFGTVPDAPISSFEANLPEEPNSALATLTPKGGLCGSSSLSMPTTIVGQNGAEVKQTTKVAITGCPKAKVTRKTHKRKRHKQHKPHAKEKKAGRRR
jgi:hypothetical protein